MVRQDHIMTAKRAKRCRLGGVWAITVLIVIAGLHTSASAQAWPRGWRGRRGRGVRDVQVNTVTSGTSMTAGGTIDAGGRNITIGMGVMRTTSDLTKTQGVTAAYFTRWGQFVQNGAALRTMYVTIDQARRVQKIIIPNKDPKAVSIAPGQNVKKLGETLRIGDAVKFNFTIIGNQIFGDKISLFKRLDTTNGTGSFVYLGSKSVRSGGRDSLTVTANAGVIPCTFKVPEEIDMQGRSRPLAKVAKALKTFCRSDLVELEYKTVNYEFVLTGVKPATMTDHGTLVKVIDGKIKGYKHMGAVIEASKRTMTLTDPEPVIKLKLKNVTNPSPDPPVQSMLKILKPGDYVMFKYRRQRGVYWLDGIYPATKPEPESESTTQPAEKTSESSSETE